MPPWKLYPPSSCCWPCLATFTQTPAHVPRQLSLVAYVNATCPSLIVLSHATNARSGSIVHVWNSAPETSVFLLGQMYSGCVVDVTPSTFLLSLFVVMKSHLVTMNLFQRITYHKTLANRFLPWWLAAQILLWITPLNAKKLTTHLDTHVHQPAGDNAASTQAPLLKLVFTPQGKITLE
jgi:hypothetical protein